MGARRGGGGRSTRGHQLGRRERVDTRGQLTLANSDGFVGQYRTTSASLSVALAGRAGRVKQRDGWYTSTATSPSSTRPGRSASWRRGGPSSASAGGRSSRDRAGGRRPAGGGELVGVSSARPRSGPFTASPRFWPEGGRGDRLAAGATIVDDATLPTDRPRPLRRRGGQSSQVTVVEKGVPELRLRIPTRRGASTSGRRATRCAATSRRRRRGVELYLKAGASDPRESSRASSGALLTELTASGSTRSPATCRAARSASGSRTAS